MNKIAIVTDSNSGITQAESGTLGIFVLPMPFNVGDKEFLEDISLSQQEFYQKLNEGANISTSQPSIDSVLNLWDELLKSHDQIVHIPMSSGLSGSCNTAKVLANEYEGKVFVVDNQRISVTQRQSALDAKALAQSGKNGETIKRVLEEQKYQSSIYITLDTLKYLKKGGRITPAAAALGTLLKIKPVLQIQGGKLDAFAKARTLKQAKATMIDTIKNDIKERFEVSNVAEDMHIFIAHTDNLGVANELKEEVLSAFPGIEIYVDNLSLSVACHIGSGSIAIACSKRIPREYFQ